MTVDEAQANPNILIGTMFVFDTLALVLLHFGSSKSFVSNAFALHANRELVPLKNRLIVTTPLGEQIPHTSVFK